MKTSKEVLTAIDNLSNVLQEVETKKEKDDIAYLIHRIIENGVTAEIRDEITGWKIQGKKDLFVKA